MIIFLVFFSKWTIGNSYFLTIKCKVTKRPLLSGQNSLTIYMQRISSFENVNFPIRFKWTISFPIDEKNHLKPIELLTMKDFFVLCICLRRVQVCLLLPARSMSIFIVIANFSCHRYTTL